MKPFVNFTFPSGHVYRVPTSVIAANRAKHYASEFDGDEQRSLKEDTEPLFTSHPNEVNEWAKNNMNWEELADQAFLIRFEGSDPANAWMEATGEVSDGELPGQLRGETLLRQPLEMILATMAAEQSNVNAIYVERPGGANKIAFITIRGPESVVDAYMMMLNHFTHHLAEEATKKEAAATGALVEGSTTTN